jgi:hypothetical protein
VDCQSELFQLLTLPPSVQIKTQNFSAQTSIVHNHNHITLISSSHKSLQQLPYSRQILDRVFSTSLERQQSSSSTYKRTATMHASIIIVGLGAFAAQALAGGIDTVVDTTVITVSISCPSNHSNCLNDSKPPLLPQYQIAHFV